MQSPVFLCLKVLKSLAPQQSKCQFRQMLYFHKLFFLQHLITALYFGEIPKTLPLWAVKVDAAVPRLRKWSFFFTMISFPQSSPALLYDSFIGNERKLCCLSQLSLADFQVSFRTSYNAAPFIFALSGWSAVISGQEKYIFDWHYKTVMGIFSFWGL